MKALTVNQTAVERSTVPAKLRKLAKCFTSVLFSERVALTIVSVGSVAGFIAGVTDHPRLCTVIGAAIVPFLMSQLNKEGGMK